MFIYNKILELYKTSSFQITILSKHHYIHCKIMEQILTLFPNSIDWNKNTKIHSNLY